MGNQILHRVLSASGAGVGRLSAEQAAAAGKSDLLSGNLAFVCADDVNIVEPSASRLLLKRGGNLLESFRLRVCAEKQLQSSVLPQLGLE